MSKTHTSTEIQNQHPERIIEKLDTDTGTWHPIYTLRGFTHQAAIAKLTEQGRRHGYGHIRMR